MKEFSNISNNTSALCDKTRERGPLLSPERCCAMAEANQHRLNY